MEALPDDSVVFLCSAKVQYMSQCEQHELACVLAGSDHDVGGGANRCGSFSDIVSQCLG